MKLAVKAALAATALSLAAPASAAVYRYDVTGDATFSFDLDDQDLFIYEPGNFAIYTFGATPDAVGFGDASVGGGFLLGNLDGGALLFISIGPQLYADGPVPSLLTGTFKLGNPFGGPGGYTLNVTQLAAAVPEPGAWALLILGFGAVGAALRRARTVRTRLAHAF